MLSFIQFIRCPFHLAIYSGFVLFAAMSPVSLAEGVKQDVILITSKELAPSWQKFADWKGSLGKSVKIISVADIDSYYKGVDIQEKIRLCVRDYIDNYGAKWVILGGDSLPNGKGVVPDRDTKHTTNMGKYTDIPTDIYYLSATNWDADGDGVYGEFDDDKEAISYPDGSVALGRIPVRTAQDVAAYTAKVISYESGSPIANFSDTFSYICPVPQAYAKLKRSWDDHISQVMSAEKNRMLIYLQHYTPWDKKTAGDYPLSPANLVSFINQKQSSGIHIHGHGLINGWVLEENDMFTHNQVSKLTNKDAYPVITTVSCFTGHYDDTQDPCIAESMLRVPDAGAVALVAPARTGKPHFLNPEKDFPLMATEGKMDGTTATMTYFWKYSIGKKLSIGESLMKTKADMAEKAKQSTNFHLCLSELNLLGDPTLNVQLSPQD